MTGKAVILHQLLSVLREAVGRDLLLRAPCERSADPGRGEAHLLAVENVGVRAVLVHLYHVNRFLSCEEGIVELERHTRHSSLSMSTPEVERALTGDMLVVDSANRVAGRSDEVEWVWVQGWKIGNLALRCLVGVVDDRWTERMSSQVG